MIKQVIEVLMDVVSIVTGQLPGRAYLPPRSY